MRIECWEKMLDEHLSEAIKTPFEWGVYDCLVYASDWCKIVCGVDPMSESIDGVIETIRGGYKNKKEARSLIKLHRKSIRNVMDVHFEKIAVNFAQRGDIVIHKMSFGISVGRGKAMFKTEDLGMVSINLSDCEAAWRT